MHWRCRCRLSGLRKCRDELLHNIGIDQVKKRQSLKGGVRKLRCLCEERAGLAWIGITEDLGLADEIDEVLRRVGSQSLTDGIERSDSGRQVRSRGERRKRRWIRSRRWLTCELSVDAAEMGVQWKGLPFMLKGGGARLLS